MSNSIQRALNIQLGLASDDETPELGGDVEAVAETAAVAEGAVEVADATDEVVEADQTVDELSEAHENLEEVSEALEEAAANGGISQESARFAHLAIKAACGRFYSPAIASALPSVESFTGSSSRQRNTTIALESVGTMLRSFWDAIVRQIKKLWATVKNWYLKVLDAAPRLKKKAESLAKRAGDLTGAAAEKNIDIGVLRQLHVNGRAPDGSAAKAMLKDLGDTAADVLGGTTSGKYDNLFDDFEKHLEDVSDIDDEKLKGYSKLGGNDGIYGSKASNNLQAITLASLRFTNEIGKVKFNGSGTVEEATKRYGEDVKVSGTPELFGGRQIVAKSSTLKETSDRFTLMRVLRDSGIVFGDFKAKPKDVESSGSFKTLSTGDIRAICDEISDICDNVMTYKKAWEARDKQFNKMDSSARKAIANVEKDKDAAPIKARLVKDIAGGLAGAFQLATRSETALINYLLAVSRSLITWVERSIAQYK